MNDRILILGQTPPPYHGQAMMIEKLVNSKFESPLLFHIRMAFSSNIKEVGTIKASKLIHLLYIICKAIFYRFRYKIKIIYYPPASPNLSPLMRDIFLLSILRLFYPVRVFHYRAAGVSEFVERRSWLLRKMAFHIYGGADLAIQLSKYNPSDGKYFNAKIIRYIPNGLEDASQLIRDEGCGDNYPVRILYVGMLSESKGVLTLIHALSQIFKMGVDFECKLIGEFESDRFEQIVKSEIKNFRVEKISIVGRKVGIEKWKFYKKCDIFCFPSYYESESFGNVVVEAMMFSKPVVAAKWRGVQDIIRHGETGFLYSPNDVDKFAEYLMLLVRDKELRTRMGLRGRAYYEKYYTLGSHIDNMKNALNSVLNRSI